VDNNNFQKEENLTKKQKADRAGKDVAEAVAEGVGQAYGGPVGRKLVGYATKTEAGQKALERSGKRLSNASPVTRNILSKNQDNIHHSKPIMNSLVGGSGENNSDNNTDNMTNLDNDLSSDNETENISGKFSGLSLWNKLSLKNKLIIISVIGGFFLFVIVFLLLFITPLIHLGIIDIGGSGSSSSSLYGYSSIDGNTKYWWPVGSIETYTENGITYAGGKPVSTNITSSFGDQESFRNSGHGGIDIGHGGYGTGKVPIIAARDGKVIYPVSANQVSQKDSGNLQGGGYGNYVKIQHDDGTITVYAHLYMNSVKVFAGDTVKQGQVIGKMGASGNVTGPHLHFEVIVDGVKTYPLNYVDPDNPRPKEATGAINLSTGTSNKQTVCLTLKKSGFPNNSVAALMTNINAESSFNTGAIGDNGTSYGLCQWHNSRWDNLRNTFPSTYQTVGGQLEFLMYELKNYSIYTSFLQGSKSAADLTYDFCYDFERPYDKANTCRKRANNSGTFVTYVNNGCN